MLELLIVIAVAGGLVVAGLRVYGYWQQSLHYRLIDNDVTQIRQALNRYYETQGCDASTGSFEGNYYPAIDRDLNLSTRFQQRTPFIKAYHVAIIDSGRRTQQKIARPIYQLQVIAQLDPKLKQSNIRWLSARLGASTSQDGRLYWVSLPTLGESTAKQNLWVMNQSRRQFTQSMNDSSLLPLGSVSHAYCAH